MMKISLFIFIFFLCSINITNAQPMVLEHADSLVGFKTAAGEAAREVIGNVKLVQGNVVITCKRAIQYPASNRAELTGNVKLVQDTLVITTQHADYDGANKIVSTVVPVKLTDGVATLTARRGKYFMPEAKAMFSDDVTIINDSVRITAEHITHFRRSRETFASHNVKLRSLTTSTIAFSDSLAHFPQKKYSYLAPHPILIKIDSVRSGDSSFTFDTLFVSSEWMEAFHDTNNERYVAHTDVEIVRGVLGARAEQAEYNVNVGKLTMTSSPIVWHDSTQLSGDTIFAFTTPYSAERALERIEARSAAFGVMHSDSLFAGRFDQLAGNSITILVDHDTARAIVADGNALGIYFGYDDGSPRGTTRSSGDRITFNLKNKKAERVVITSGAEGKYFPEKMVRKREREYRLLGFSWREDRPIKPVLPQAH